MAKRRTKALSDPWQKLQRRVVRCRKCPRLVAHCQTIAKTKRRAFADEKYWGKPVADFGDGKASLLVMGLAPGAHGANRTGRMFTGDRSGDWLYRAMHKFGFATQAESTGPEDGLQLIDAVVSNVCRCAPPDNKPKREEITQCQPYLQQTVLLVEPKVILALGRLAWTEVLRLAKQLEWLSKEDPKPPKFSHGAEYRFPDGVWLIASYHPSQQNTFTGRLTEPMFDALFERAKKLVG